jgi:hypothetical protein
LHREHLAREELNPLGDPPAMQRLAHERLQDEEIERALEQI